MKGHARWPPLKESGLGQSELARRAGLSQVWVSRIEAGGGYGSRRTRSKLAAALEAPVWALEGEEAQPAEEPVRHPGLP
jgi:transcriptional regulator with XRE-family HTH domain